MSVMPTQIQGERNEKLCLNVGVAKNLWPTFVCYRVVSSNFKYWDLGNLNLVMHLAIWIVVFFGSSTFSSNLKTSKNWMGLIYFKKFLRKIISRSFHHLTEFWKFSRYTQGCPITLSIIISFTPGVSKPSSFQLQNSPWH